MIKLKWLLKKLKNLKNWLDNPIDNLKHKLYGEHSLGKNYYLRIKVPMKNKKYYGFEIAVIKKRKENKKCQMRMK